MTIKYVIKKSRGNYYKMPTQIGLCFGATKEEAQTFISRADAAMSMRHYAFADCEIEETEPVAGE